MKELGKYPWELNVLSSSEDEDNDTDEESDEEGEESEEEPEEESKTEPLDEVQAACEKRKKLRS